MQLAMLPLFIARILGDGVIATLKGIVRFFGFRCLLEPQPQSRQYFWRIAGLSWEELDLMQRIWMIKPLFHFLSVSWITPHCDAVSNASSIHR